jgi:acetyltransferase-like isoleucine patch superfamily enzyme
MLKLIKHIIKKFCAKVFDLAMQYQNEKNQVEYNLKPSVSFYNLSLEGNVIIGEHTYINEGTRIDTGKNGKIQIGRHCAIGRYVHITAKTHSLSRPTTDEHHTDIAHDEKDVIIGDYVWLGDKVLVMPGIIIGNYAIVGANSVVTKNVLPFEVVGGVPATHIKFNDQHYRYTQLTGNLS